jgi:NitT/TauT family transport system permease protein
LTAFASATRIGADFLEILTSMFNPLPSIALLADRIIWFGLGDNSVIFVLIHAVLWAVALNTYSGFRAVSRRLRMVGQNYGLSTVGYIYSHSRAGGFS